MAATGMHDYDPVLTDVVFDYMRSRLASDVPLDLPGDTHAILAGLDGMIAEQGNPAREVMRVYDEVISRTVISADNPRFLAFIPAAPTKAALLFDMVVSCASLQAISWLEAAGAVAAENQVLGWLARLAGLPAGAGGTFVSGGSAANLAALTVARDTGRQRHGLERSSVRVAVSEQVHSSNRSSLSILDIEPLIVPCREHRMSGDDLERALLNHDAAGSPGGPVVAVVGTAGTTNAGLVDDLAGIGRVAASRRLWFHVDAAYGGAALLAPQVRQLFAGIEAADSITMDPHKWWFAPFDVAAVIYRHPDLARLVHTQEASYLAVLHQHGEWNPTDYAYHLTRRARGLPMWFSLAVHGVAAYRAAVEASLDLTQEVADFIDSHPDLELVVPPSLSIILWRRIGWTAVDYARMQDELLRRQLGFVTPTLWQGETVGRFAFINPKTTLTMVQAMFEAVLELDGDR